MKIANCKLKIANRRAVLEAAGMRAIVFVLVPVAFAIAPLSFTTAGGAAEKAFRYDDPRLGETRAASDKFKFARVQLGPMYSGRLGDRGEPWSHDYPEAGLHFSKILSELSKVQVVLDEDEYIFAFNDPNLMKYPFAYMAEPGFMQLTDAEIAGMREYLLRGGFLLIDDFRGSSELRNLEYHLKRALPEKEYQIKPLDLSHPIFNCFFSIKSLDVHPPYGGYRPEFLGMEDKHGRLMMIINHNNDVSDYWQWSNNPFMPIDDTNSAYKFGVNYVFYALTH